MKMQDVVDRWKAIKRTPSRDHWIRRRIGPVHLST